MPELPEVETIARRLRQVIVGKHISQIEVLREKSFQGLPTDIIGSSITQITRRAKVLQLHLSSGLSLLIHLKMTGQLIYDEEGNRVGGGHPSDDWVKQLPSKHTRVIITFQEGGTLYFNDMRVFGWIKVADAEAVKNEFTNYAPDIIDSKINSLYLEKAFARRSQSIKLVIMDNKVVSGVGNIYANDALHLAKVLPTRAANSLNKDEISRVYEAAIQVILSGIELGGATIDNYRNVDGLAGGYQNVVRVYQREGEACFVCGTVIERMKQGGRSTFFCATCQV